MNSLNYIQKCRSPSYRIFCLPHAGGSSSHFNKWRKSLPENVEIISIQLAGRENRLAEIAHTEMQPLVSEIVEAIKPLTSIDYMIYGQSMGTLVAFELTLELQRQGQRLPQRLLLASRMAPHCIDPKPVISHLSDAQFISQLHNRYGGMSEVIATPDLAQLVLPALRADIRLVENYKYTDNTMVDVPIVFFSGTNDNSLTADNTYAWSQMTSSYFNIRRLSGGHFFNLKGQHDLLSYINDLVSEPEPVSNDVFDIGLIYA